MDLWHVYSWTNGSGKLEHVPSLGGNITYSIKHSYLIFIRVGQWQTMLIVDTGSRELYHSTELHGAEC